MVRACTGASWRIGSLARDNDLPCMFISASRIYFQLLFIIIVFLGTPKGLETLFSDVPLHVGDLSLVARVRLELDLDGLTLGHDLADEPGTEQCRARIPCRRRRAPALPLDRPLAAPALVCELRVREGGPPRRAPVRHPQHGIPAPAGPAGPLVRATGMPRPRLGVPRAPGEDAGIAGVRGRIPRCEGSAARAGSALEGAGRANRPWFSATDCPGAAGPLSQCVSSQTAPGDLPQAGTRRRRGRGARANSRSGLRLMPIPATAIGSAPMRTWRHWDTPDMHCWPSATCSAPWTISTRRRQPYSAEGSARGWAHWSIGSAPIVRTWRHWDCCTPDMHAGPRRPASRAEGPGRGARSFSGIFSCSRAGRGTRREEDIEGGVRVVGQRKAAPDSCTDTASQWLLAPSPAPRCLLRVGLGNCDQGKGQVNPVAHAQAIGEGSTLAVGWAGEAVGPGRSEREIAGLRAGQAGSAKW